MLVLVEKFFILFLFTMLYTHMANIKLWTLAKTSFIKSTIYTPIVEAIVNSINAIEEKNKTMEWWKIVIKFLRDNQASIPWLWDDWDLKVIWIEIKDNWIWFNDANLESFSTVYSEYKKNSWWLWFWRISYIKFFENVSFDSKYNQDGKIFNRVWKFTPDNELFWIKKNESSWETWTILVFKDIKKDYINSIDKSFEVLVRKICIELLGYYAFDYKLPEIIFQDSWNPKNKITFNDFLKSTEKINKYIDKEKINIWDKSFVVSFIKIYHYNNHRNSVNLCANWREVVSYSMGDIEKLFQEPFIDWNDRYIISVYVAWEYLDNSVNSERKWFYIPQNQSEKTSFPESNLSMEEILWSIWELLREKISWEYEIREKKKDEILNKYFEENPMYNWYRQEIWNMKWWTSTTQQEIAIEVAKLELSKREKVYRKFEQIKKWTLVGEDAIKEVLSDISDFNITELAKYVINRKKILDLLKDKLNYINPEDIKWNDSDYQKENIVHNFIFPMRRDSNDTSYWEHNLWLLDERLSYSSFISSDNTIEPKKKNWDRWDIVFFQDAIAFREWEEKQNPVIIVEFKRPWRKNYKPDEDPIKQVWRYAKKIREWSMNTKKWRIINAGADTPIYWYIVCDLTDPIKQFAEDNSLTLTYDAEWYIWYHQWYWIYFEIMSWDKVVKDANQRNKIFFERLWLNK